MGSQVSKKYSFWNDHIKKWKESGLSQPAYCEAQGIKLSTFSYYRHIFLKSQQQSPAVRFVPVKPKRENVSPAVNSLQLLLPNGIRVMVPSEAPESLLKMVLIIAGQAPC